MLDTNRSIALGFAADERARKENAALSDLEYDVGKTVLECRPRIEAIEGTNHCNIKCVMCPRGEPDIMRRDVGHMSLTTFENALRKAEYFSEPTWLHWFGEPLMNPSFFDLLATAKTKIPVAGISTNATLLNERNQELLLDSDLDTLIIAIDGDTKDVYENVRKSARFTFERVAANAESFLKKRRRRGQTTPHVILSIIVMSETAADTKAFREHWLSRGADEVLFKPFVNWGGQDRETFDGLAQPSVQRTLAADRPHACKWLWESFVVTWDGKVVPCCYDFDAKLVLGDINSQTIEEIWNGPAYREVRRAELEGRNDAGPCAGCRQAPGRPRDPSRANGEGLGLLRRLKRALLRG